MAANLFYAQSGGVTAVINTTACGVIQAAREHGDVIGKVFAGRNGILGALHEDLIDTSLESDAAIAALRHTPGGAFGSCRYKLKGLEESRAQYERLIEVFRAHDIRWFLYNGGNDSMDTAWKVSQIAEKLHYPLTCVGIPKTVDNDLVETDNCPGFGSVAKYVAVSMMEAGLDVASMARTSTKIFVMEVMGRHAGWITAAAGLAARTPAEAPHILLFPEIPFDEAAFLARVDACVREHDFCAIAVSEGLRGSDGRLLAESGTRDAFGHAQLGGVGQQIAELIKTKLGHKYHWALPDYLQRSGRHIASGTDAQQAYALGRRAVELAIEGRNAVMPAIVRLSDTPYAWKIDVAQLQDVANREKMMPRHFISDDGFGITDACRKYLQPLIEGEDYPPYVNGLPAYVSLKNESVPRTLPPFAG
ncbi:Pyrophosphate-dependent phosphofructokinase [Methyloversatilis universalis FAM5]|uniref:Pyrophosphate--fructose 6-phosphate 1-phosphotransferase n=1 Tax=Methyloversatilis universalis (strain ATCC BAA-1314 / DSM 25237 / JCM 13912 / CCUG 52030 / FAM5) TaxID=1000565 RepID=F5RB19_METUF|nr:6-phosphofructokinase [Methyloversatilis universalis]EGK72280.1 Pyrophosphate-dependent phosphofructokinase [Methyloversatilis universalis FAM5]